METKAETTHYTPFWGMDFPWYGCIDATEFIPAGSVHSTDIGGRTVSTVRRGCEWTWTQEKCRTRGLSVRFHDGVGHTSAPCRYL